MAFERFVPADGLGGAISDAEGSYLLSLIENAQMRGRLPVLTATRSLGRIAGIKARFPGLHVFLYRNLFQQWCSYGEQAFLRNSYFVRTVNVILDAGGHDPILRRIREMFPCNDADAASPNQFYRFVFLHLYLYGAAAETADLVVDVNRLEADAAYRDGIAGDLTAYAGFPVTITGARTSIGFSLVEPSALAHLESNLRLLSPLVLEATSSATGRQFVERAVGDLVEEHDRYDFYMRRLASSVTGATGLLAERDALVARADATQRAIGEFEAERAELVATRDALMAERDDARHKADLLEASQAALAGERDAAVAQRNAAAARQTAAEQALSALQAEHVSLIDARDAAASQHAASQQMLDALQTERNRLAAERDAILASTTWRLGKPLRLLARLLGRGRPARQAPMRRSFF